MKITEQLEPYYRDFESIIESFLYEMNSSRIRDAIIQKMYDALQNEPEVNSFDISDISDDETIDQGHIMLQFTNPENKESLTLQF